MEPVDVYILTGYLGAGKTTTLNHLLSSTSLAERKLALIINEFGSMGVDGKLLAPGNYAKYEINKGSIFCICTKTDFIKVLSDIGDNCRPEAVFIEATGIAEPGDIESIINDPYFEGRFRVAANLCIVDAAGFTKAAPFLKPVTSQVRFADGIVVNKTDLAADGDLEKLQSVLADINPDAQIVFAENGSVPLEFVDGLNHIARPIELIQSAPAKIIACSFKTDGVVIKDKFFECVDQLGEKILRLKGNIDFGQGVVFAEIVYDRYSEKDSCGGLGDATAFTVIAWDVDKEELKESFQRCWQ